MDLTQCLVWPMVLFQESAFYMNSISGYIDSYKRQGHPHETPCLKKLKS